MLGGLGAKPTGSVGLAAGWPVQAGWRRGGTLGMDCVASACRQDSSAHRSTRALADLADDRLGWLREVWPSTERPRSSSIAVGSGVGAKFWGERKGGEKEKKKVFGFVRVFKT